MKGGKVDRGGQQVLRTRVRTRPAEREVGFLTVVEEVREQIDQTTTLRLIAHCRPGQQRPQMIGTAVQQRIQAAADGHQPESLLIGPNCSIGGAAPFSSGQMAK